MQSLYQLGSWLRSLKKELFINAWAEVRTNRKGRSSTEGCPQQEAVTSSGSSRDKGRGCATELAKPSGGQSGGKGTRQMQFTDVSLLGSQKVERGREQTEEAHRKCPRFRSKSPCLLPGCSPHET